METKQTTLESQWAVSHKPVTGASRTESMKKFGNLVDSVVWHLTLNGTDKRSVLKSACATLRTDKRASVRAAHVVALARLGFADDAAKLAAV